MNKDLAVEKSESLECAVCLDECLYATQIQCKHIFCYLCLKGLKDRRCPLCRQIFPKEDTERPRLVNGEPLYGQHNKNDIVWFYESRTSDQWWQYDERTSAEIEEAFARGAAKLDIVIASDTYTISFDYGIQIPHRILDRCRRIRRATRSFGHSKGVAGIFLPSNMRYERHQGKFSSRVLASFNVNSLFLITITVTSEYVRKGVTLIHGLHKLAIG